MSPLSSSSSPNGGCPSLAKRARGGGGSHTRTGRATPPPSPCAAVRGLRVNRLLQFPDGVAEQGALFRRTRPQCAFNLRMHRVSPCAPPPPHKGPQKDSVTCRWCCNCGALCHGAHVAGSAVSCISARPNSPRGMCWNGGVDPKGGGSGGGGSSFANTHLKLLCNLCDIALWMDAMNPWMDVQLTASSLRTIKADKNTNIHKM